MKQLFVNADDFGLHGDINRAIASGVNKGRIQGISISANGAAFDGFLIKELNNGGAALGVHLTWADETWLTGDGGLSRAMIMKHLAMNPSGFAIKLRQEARAQIERLLDIGIRPDHVDSHQHIHVLPRLWSITRELAREYSIPRIRLPLTSSFGTIRRTPGAMFLQLLSRFRQREIPTAWPCAGIARSGRNTSGVIRRELEASSSQTLELIVHPAYATASLSHRYRHWGYDWDSERAMLMDDHWPLLMEECGYETCPEAIGRSGKEAGESDSCGAAISAPKSAEERSSVQRNIKYRSY